MGVGGVDYVRGCNCASGGREGGVGVVVGVCVGAQNGMRV